MAARTNAVICSDDEKAELNSPTKPEAGSWYEYEPATLDSWVTLGLLGGWSKHPNSNPETTQHVGIGIFDENPTLEQEFCKQLVGSRMFRSLILSA